MKKILYDGEILSKKESPFLQRSSSGTNLKTSTIAGGSCNSILKQLDQTSPSLFALWLDYSCSFQLLNDT